MIKVYLGSNFDRTTVVIDESQTLRSVLTDNKVDYTRGVMHLDGASLQPGDLDKSFSDFNITKECYLLNIVKADNGYLYKMYF